MTTVPYIAVSAQNVKREDKEVFFQNEDLWLIKKDEVYDAQKQIDFVNNALRTDVKLKVTFMKIARDNLIIIVVIVLLFNLVTYAYNFLIKPWVWYSIALVVFFVCTGGVIYSRLNNMPWFKFEKNEYGSIHIAEYIMDNARG